MGKRIKKILLYLIIICFSVSGITQTQVVYASTPKKAIKAYKKFLKQNSYTINSASYDMKKSQFTVKDINNDRVKELIMFPNADAMCTVVVYSFYKGKMRYVLSAGHSDLGYFNKKSVFVSEWGSMGIKTVHYSVYKKGKLRDIASLSDYKYFDSTMENEYRVSGKKVSKRSFYKMLKKKYNILKPRKYKYIPGNKRYTVTKANIKKYVK